MSVGKAGGKEAIQYARNQSDEGGVVTSRETTAPENEVHSSDHTHRKSIGFRKMSVAKEAGSFSGVSP